MSSDMKEGFQYIFNKKEIGIIILMLMLLCLFVASYNTLLPVYAKEIFQGNALTFGYISSFFGLGAVIATIYLASLKDVANYRKLLLINITVLGVSLIAFSHTYYFPLSMLFAVICGFATMSFIPICNTILQLETDKYMRGRVISYFAMAAFGMLPLGSLLIGTVSKIIGAPNSILCQGIMALIIAALFSGFLKNNQLKNLNTKHINNK